MKGSFIYADNAATTSLVPEALEAMTPFLTLDYANASGLYSFARTAKKALQESREQIASCIGAKPSEIYFTSGGTESDNWALKGVVDVTQGDKCHVITSQIEHHAVLNSCKSLEQFSVKVDYLAPDKVGRILAETLASAIQPETKIVSIMTANNEIGTIQNIATLSQIAHQQGILFHTDAVQAVGHIPVNVDELGVDLLSVSAHKFNGPKGIGFLYIRHGTKIASFLDGGQQESGLRAGTENVAGIVGMATALNLNCSQMSATAQKLQSMESEFRKTILQTIPTAVFNGDSNNHLPGLISLSIENVSAEGLLHILDLKGIAVSTGAACNSQSTEISHVLSAIRLSETLAKGTLRISFGKNNQLEDAHCVAQTIIKFIKTK